jgi:hypothetical protein
MTPLTVVDEGETVNSETVATPVTSAVEGCIAVEKRVLEPSTNVMDGVMENMDIVERPVTEVVSTGTINEEGGTGPTTISVIACVIEEANSMKENTKTQSALTPRPHLIVSPSVSMNYGVAGRKRRTAYDPTYHPDT